MNYTIAVNGLLLHAPIGVYGFEKDLGNDFEVTLNVEVSAADSLTDDVECTLNYAQLVETTQLVMSEPMDLLETAAMRVIRAIRQLPIPSSLTIDSVTVRIAKLSPPIPAATLHSASVTFKG